MSARLRTGRVGVRIPSGVLRFFDIAASRSTVCKTSWSNGRTPGEREVWVRFPRESLASMAQSEEHPRCLGRCGFESHSRRRAAMRPPRPAESPAKQPRGGVMSEREGEGRSRDPLHTPIGASSPVEGDDADPWSFGSTARLAQLAERPDGPREVWVRIPHRASRRGATVTHGCGRDPRERRREIQT